MPLHDAHRHISPSREMLALNKQQVKTAEDSALLCFSGATLGTGTTALENILCSAYVYIHQCVVLPRVSSSFFFFSELALVYKTIFLGNLFLRSLIAKET